MADVESKGFSQAIPSVPLCDVEPEAMSCEAATSSRHMQEWERTMMAELEGLRTTNTFVTAEHSANGKRA